MALRENVSFFEVKIPISLIDKTRSNCRIPPPLPNAIDNSYATTCFSESSRWSCMTFVRYSSLSASLLTIIPFASFTVIFRDLTCRAVSLYQRKDGRSEDGQGEQLRGKTLNGVLSVRLPRGK